MAGDYFISPSATTSSIGRTTAGSSSEIVFIPRPTDDPMIRQPDITLAREVLGWEPKVHVRDGLKLTIDWFRENV